LYWMMEEVARATSRHRYEHGEEFRLTAQLKRILSAEDMTQEGLSAIVGKRRNWWAVEYMRRAKYTADFEKKILLQIRSRLFRKVRIRVEDNINITADLDDPALVEVFATSAAAFLRKRKAHGAPDPQPPIPVGRNAEEYSQMIDEMFRPRVKWHSGWEKFKKSVVHLENDVVRIVAFIVDDFNTAKHDVGGELYDDSDVDKIYDELEKEEEVLEVEPEIAEEEGGLFDDEEEEDDGGGMFGEDEELEDEGMFGEEDVDNGTLAVDTPGLKVNIYEELHEDIPNVPTAWLIDFCTQHPQNATLAEYAEIKVKAQAEFLVEMSKGTPYDDANIYTKLHDISDRRA